MKFRKANPNLNSWKRRFLFVLIPILILVTDYKFFPVVVETYNEDKPADITYLLTHQSQFLGRFKGHHISVSVDDIRGSQFLNFLKEKSNALVVSVFHDENTPYKIGPLLGAALQQLQRLSPNDHRKIRDRLGKKGSMRSGEVIPFSLDLPRDKYKEFPVDVLLILVFDSGNVEEKELGAGIKSVISQARQKKITNLVLPCLGFNWESQPKIGFSDFFKVVFANLSASDSPLHLYLSLYAQWPSYLLENAVAGLNASLEADLPNPAAAPSIYRSDMRLPLVFLTLCIFVCSFFARLTIVNLLVIGLSFIGISLGSHQLIDLFAQGYPPKFRFFLQIAILMVLAFGFPFIVTWDVKSIFKPKD